ncbi:MAG TPA: LLM class flavin-dependent oxidoreductase [Nocardioides sp.]|uniref:LLM class flavin-dependent oxidoreductase n=1 Tax=Nocardioides sp. TaxID=35761 RepID=UPI002E3794D7|nr:LLM class flavin-dependent oxidoreductase [Nocardioides sp.]HEX5090412.1 LLM class flavin-dependent oxidoreductase [Nocardioides sp.]
MSLPDPAVVVLVGPSGAGKSTWAAAHYRRDEIVSSDALRAVVGSGPHDLDASADAFDLLERIVNARTGRRLTTVVDTLGTDETRRRGWLARAREVGLPAVVVVFDTPDAECRRRNAARDRPVPAPTLAAQLKRHRAVVAQLELEGWDELRTVTATEPAPESGPAPAARTADRRNSQGLDVVLQVSRFPWGQEPLAWLTGVARAADEAGFAGLSVMDHLIQIPQVDRAWSPIPEPWVTLGAVAGLGTELRLGTLVTPVTFRAPGITAKAAATLDVLTGGRAFVGVGAGWWEREHAAFGLDLPPPRQRLDDLERGIETMRALWASGTKAYDGRRVSLPETTSYPRPVGDLPVIVGGTGPRTLRIAATLGDAANLPSARPRLDELVGTLRRHSETVRITVLDLPTIGADREDTWARVERLRGRTSAAAYAERTHAGTAADQRDRWGGLAELGVDTVFVGIADLEGAEDVERLAPLLA